MAAADSTTYSAALKRLYPQTDVERAMYENNPCLAMMPKKYDFFGESMHLAIRYASTAGRSATFQNAKNNKVSSALDKWLITVTQDYSLYSVTGKVARQSSNQKGAIIDALQEEVDSAMDAMNRSLGISVFRNGGGAIGQITTATPSAQQTITLTDINAIVNFEKNMYLATATTDGTSGTVKPGLTQVKSVDRDAGTITVYDANWGVGIPSVAQNDFIFADGDFGLKMKGLDAWLPGTAPTAGDSFFGMDRSNDPVRLAGVRVDGRNRLIEEAVKLALQKSFRNGGKVSHIFMNDSNFLDLDLSLGSRRQYVDTDVAGVGFTGIKFTAPGVKSVEVYPDPNCPYNVAYGLTMSNWSIRGPGNFPFIEERDGNRILREDAADAFEGRIVSYHQAMCTSPGRSFRLLLG